jgi:hypothetical protein
MRRQSTGVLPRHQQRIFDMGMSLHQPGYQEVASQIYLTRPAISTLWPDSGYTLLIDGYIGRIDLI